VRFVCVTPNAAVDRILHLSQPRAPHGLNRVARAIESAGGKGMNVARVLRALGADVTVAGFLAGLNATRFEALLERDGLDGPFVRVAGETRECQIVVDGHGQPMEINDPGPLAEASDWERLAAGLPEGRLVISGSLPPGLSPEQFGRFLTAVAERRGEKPVVDTSGPFLVAAVAAGVALVKPNEHEIGLLSPGTADPIAAAREAYARTGVPVLLTLGAAGAAYVGAEGAFVPAPAVDAVNPVASGDCLLAAFLWASAQAWSTAEALRLGVAAGAANARLGGGGQLSREEVFGQLRQVAQASVLG
jgi:tagatose 6-phosphate kinase